MPRMHRSHDDRQVSVGGIRADSGIVHAVVLTKRTHTAHVVCQSYKTVAPYLTANQHLVPTCLWCVAGVEPEPLTYIPGKYTGSIP